MSKFNKIPFRLKNNLPYLNLKIGKKEYKNCLFDLGNLNQITLKEKDSTTITTNERLIINRYDYHSFFNSINSALYKVYKTPVITIKKTTVKSLNIINAKIIFSHLRSIGLGLFYDSILILDYKDKNIYINNSKISMKENSKNEKFIKIDWNGKFFISQVKVDNLILKYDIKAGDTVNYINDIDLTSDFSEKNICAILKDLNKEIKKDTFTLKLNRWKVAKKIYSK